jgi:hypothetical protein
MMIAIVADDHAEQGTKTDWEGKAVVVGMEPVGKEATGRGTP